MITIPEYHYKDDAFEFVCPALELQSDEALELQSDEAWQMLAALAEPTWSSTLRKMEYICHAMAALGFDSQVVADALVDRYSCESLDACVFGTMEGVDFNQARDAANQIRGAWCDHMRTCLKQALS